MFTLNFWRAASERALKTAAQTAIVALGADKLGTLFAADFANVAGMAAGGALLSVLTSIATSAVGDTPSPSLVPDAEADLAN